jgi:hypothetical protein
MNDTKQYSINEVITIRDALGLRRRKAGNEHMTLGSNVDHEPTGNGLGHEDIGRHNSHDSNSRTMR